ncbi:UPF0182 family protein [Nocardioides daphniae]|uniref:UPF0182 protein E2C04_12485 n=1 Tax=Nocardioides daphniae TaxID=402297 RepID=A0A4P7UCM8_9ACTN|nr:UPF0182 family protein [Nocardioides daphniae]QCC77796.1 UPF0182 family protein [Nocardioides daphniae]GGD28290.1 UPF0182 protein [Nocardioides daphniae]
MSLFGPPAAAAPAPGPPQRRSRALVITAGILLVGFLALTAFSAFWTERLWFKSVDFSGVFTTLVLTRIGLFLVFGVLMAVVVALNMYLAHRFRPFFRPTSVEQESLDRYREAIKPVKGWALAGFAVLMGLFAGASGSGRWREFTTWRHSENFGTKDPYFDKDVSFYVFELGWLHFVVDFLLAAAVVGLLAALVVHYLYGGIRLQAQRDKFSPAAQIQVSVLLGVAVLAKAADYWLDRYDLLNSSGSLITGMNFTDDNAVLPAKNILVGIAIICAVLFFLNVWRRTWMLPSVGIALLALSAILLGMLWPGIVQRFQVAPNQPDKEAAYIEKNIEATRAAYNLDDVEVNRYTSAPDLGSALAQLETGTSSVPLVDPKLVSPTFEQQQQVRAYYTVPDVLDVDRYTLDGQERALVLGVRELDQSGLAESDRNWANLHTVYTHGSGMIAAYANQRPADDGSQAEAIQWAEGQEAGQKALSELSDEPFEQRVYFGETSPSYSVVGKSGEDGKDVELDLPRGEEGSSPTSTYDGEGGVPVGSAFNRLLYAVKYGEPNFLLSGRIYDDSKILYDRNPRRMVEKVAPWLTVDSDPYPVVVDGRIQWVLDGYTVTDKYPLSQKESFEDMIDDSLQDDLGFQTLPTDEINYVRNAVKATVDAYDGTVKLYAWDEEDPILKVWRNVFPGTVLDKDEIPEALVSHLRYPEDLFKAQRYQFARYHVTDPKDWYAGNNRWEVPNDPNVENSQQPPYRLFANPQGDEDPNAEQIWSLTSVYVPRDKNNLAAFVSVNSDATSSDYGKIQVLELSDERTNGPVQVANEIASDEDVRDELFSFDQGGINPRYGNLLTLPVGDGLMYVQPLYAARDASESSYPILSFVLVSYGGNVGIAPTLRGAIADVLGVDDSGPTPSGSGDGGKGGDKGGDQPPASGTVNQQIRSLLAQAEKQFAAADKAQRDGDTVAWAEAIEKAKELVNEAVELSEKK